MLGIIIELVVNLIVSIPLGIIVFLGEHLFITVAILLGLLIYIIWKKKYNSILYYISAILCGVLSFYTYTKYLPGEDASFGLKDSMQGTFISALFVIPCIILIVFLIIELTKKDITKKKKK